ncbi:hypothetical protein [Nocardioides conyzicola]|uniref:DUF3558 domain-containing protein n=1 Tax=Nocardioides conyzicola TaxID=1651781 RepID=A0ABP8WX29_9ACTN
MPVVRRTAVLIAAATLALALAGCTSDDSDPPAQPRASSTPLADFATDDVSVARAAFCPRIAPEAVAEALGAEPDGSEAWANGDRARLADGLRDVAHEYGCSWTAADGTVARAWVFAPPVTSARAAVLARQARRAEGCQSLADAPAYGAPSTAVRCGRGLAFQGLFGDAWLTCSLQTAATPPDLDRTGRWCVSVAQAASE